MGTPRKRAPSRLCALLWVSALPVPMAAQPQPVCTPPSSGIVGWWPGDDNAQDLKGSNDGAPAGGATFVSGLVGNAFSFDGATGYIDVPTANGLPTSTWTIEFWFFLNSNTVSQPFVTNFDGAGSRYFIEFFLDPTLPGKPGLRIGHVSSGVPDLNSNVTPTAGVWHHLAAIQSTDASIGQSLYWDGTLIGTAGAAMADPIIHLQFGRSQLSRAGEGTGFLNGMLDEISMYNGALSATEIQAIYKAGGAGKCKGCQAALSIPEFAWKEYDLQWGLMPYDHSYVSNPFFFSVYGHMQLVVGPNTYPLDISTANNLVGLAKKINALQTGVFAIPASPRLRVYNEVCLSGGNCYPLTDNLLQLCDGSCTGTNNILAPKYMSAFGCSITALAMALKFAGISSVSPFTTLDPGSLNRFMSNDLSSASTGGLFNNVADIDWDGTTSLVALSSGVPLPRAFRFDDTGRGAGGAAANSVLDNHLCSDQVPVIVKVTGRNSGGAHFVLVTG